MLVISVGREGLLVNNGGKRGEIFDDLRCKVKECRFLKENEILSRDLRRFDLLDVEPLPTLEKGSLKEFVSNNFRFSASAVSYTHLTLPTILLV